MGGTAYPVAGCASEDVTWSIGLNPCNDGYGNTVRIQNDSGRYVQLAHLSSVLVQWGEAVEAGQVVGFEGNSGNAGTKHVHFSAHAGDARAPSLGPSIPFQLVHSAGASPVEALVCGDFSVSSVPLPESLLTSTNETRPVTESLQAEPVTPYPRLAHWVLSGERDARSRALIELRSLNDDVGRYWFAVGLAGGSELDVRAARGVFEELAADADVRWVRDWSAFRTCQTLASLGRPIQAKRCAMRRRKLVEQSDNELLSAFETL
jgi:hypothetical protein